MNDEDWLGSNIDFTIARGIQNKAKIRAIRDYFLSRQTAVIDTKRTAINNALDETEKTQQE